MATKYSDLELAINSLVTEFHSAADNKPTMNTSQFQSLLSKQMPAIAKTMEGEEGLGKILQQMGVQSGQNISFENFWNLINSQAGQLFDTMHKEKNVKCNCILQ
ncbi:S100 calcium binding protein V2 [Mugil cephalus]|uniref:S100 calcium binding protein V2 n=1 Tax=Mugil cephalus TaxID=48193 RepID=UPI001FB602C9|nr:S100 calcium binding protein V2 [Mugil cephalus]